MICEIIFFYINKFTLYKQIEIACLWLKSMGLSQSQIEVKINVVKED